MNENFIKNEFKNLRPSSTLNINEISKKLIAEGKKIYKFGLGQSPFPIPEIILLFNKIDFIVALDFSIFL